MHAAGGDVEGGARADDLRLAHCVAGGADRELEAAALDVDHLVLAAVELQRERLALLDEELLAHVLVGVGPDQLVAPGLVDLARLERPGVEAFEVGRVEVIVHGNVSACAGISASAATRRPASSVLPSPTRAPGPTTDRPLTWQPGPRSAPSPTIEPSTMQPEPSVQPACTTACSTTEPSPTCAPAPITARLPTRTPASITAFGPTMTGGTSRASGLT